MGTGYVHSSAIVNATAMNGVRRNLEIQTGSYKIAMGMQDKSIENAVKNTVMTWYDAGWSVTSRTGRSTW